MILATRPLVDNEIDPGLLESSFVLPTHGHGGPASGQGGVTGEEEDGPLRIPKTSSNTTNSVSTSAGGRGAKISTRLQQHERQDTDVVEEPVKFVLLAEFDIDQGATLTHQYPFPTGTDEHTLAELMLPDGAHLRPEDWTIFYLNQTRRNAVAPVLASESPSSATASAPLGSGAGSGVNVNTGAGAGATRGEEGKGEELGELLFVLNCVRMKEDKSVRRGAMVKALAICTTKPYIQIYKPLLLLALEEYYQSSSPQVLAKLFDSLNNVSLRGCPTLSRAERIILRNSERKDLFAEKFISPGSGLGLGLGGNVNGASGGMEGDTGEAGGMEDLDVFEPDWVPEGLGSTLNASSNSGPGGGVTIHNGGGAGSGSGSGSGLSMRKSFKSTLTRLSDGSGRRMRKTSRSSLLGDKEVGMGSESSGRPGSSRAASPSTNTNQAQIQQQQQNQQYRGLGIGRPEVDAGGTVRKAVGPKDTHYFDTVAEYSGLSIPIRVPLSIFPEEVGDYSIIQLIQTFTPSVPVPFAPPFHPHLHTAGAFTHPIILLLNALLTQKRIIFLGHGQPAGHVANFVLAACALTAPVLRGFAERAFPYSNLAGLDILEEVPGYIAGVTNPRFEDLPHTWDLLCNLETGRITVSKGLMSDNGDRDTSMKTPTSTEQANWGNDTESLSGHAGGPSNKEMRSYNPDTPDNMFMEEIVASINAHYGEPAIRARFTEYISKFVRMAARYEEEFYGQTSIGYPSQPFRESSLGGGFIFPDESTKTKEWSTNANRIEGWRRTRSYRYWREDFRTWLDSPFAVPQLDVQHQLSRLRNAKTMSESEAALIYRSLAASVTTYPRIADLISQLPHHNGGLTPIALGLFHPSQSVRNAVLDLLDRMQQYPIGVIFLGKLNCFQRLAYQRLSEERETPRATAP
ncbi:hypothetical protein FFLO_02944 [Filobasidium floriforme]|uniref:UDENN domain-containing protein n=1 Tax=Filobasidium floriforme TaxID=5210 RepID=A0A8K0JN55_9TREE|nr:hypothetical protein FFLO_02944 [Filobasidium floriforme]